MWCLCRAGSCCMITGFGGVPFRGTREQDGTNGPFGNSLSQFWVPSWYLFVTCSDHLPHLACAGNAFSFAIPDYGEYNKYTLATSVFEPRVDVIVEDFPYWQDVWLLHDPRRIPLVAFPSIDAPNGSHRGTQPVVLDAFAAFEVCTFFFCNTTAQQSNESYPRRLVLQQ